MESRGLVMDIKEKILTSRRISSCKGDKSMQAHPKVDVSTGCRGQELVRRTAFLKGCNPCAYTVVRCVLSATSLHLLQRLVIRAHASRNRASGTSRMS